MPRIHTLDVSRLTPLGQLIAEYMRQQWPHLQTKAEFAHLVGVRPGTIDNLLYSQRAASSRTLNKIARATGIPAAVLYEAAAGQQPQAYVRPSTPPRPALPVEAMVPPPAPQPLTREQYAQSMQPVPSAFDEAVRRIQASWPPEMAEVMVKALYTTAGRTNPRDYWKTRIEEWKREEHDERFIKTLELPAAQPAHDADPSQAQSRPAAGRR